MTARARRTVRAGRGLDAGDAEAERQWRVLERVYGRVAGALDAALHAAHGVTLVEYRVLECLAAPDPRGRRLSVRDVAERLGVSDSTASRTLGRLGRRHRPLVRSAERDRMLEPVLTPEGEETLARAAATYSNAFASAWARAADPKEALAALVRRVACPV